MDTMVVVYMVLSGIQIGLLGCMEPIVILQMTTWIGEALASLQDHNNK